MVKDTKMLLEVKNLTVYYDSVLALNDITLNIIEGEIVAMIGPNGAGKSTALKTVCGLLTPTSGQVIFQGENINGVQPYSLVKKGLSLVPEGRRLFSTMSVLENLEMGAFTKTNHNSIKKELQKIYSLFPILHERRKQQAGTLSSGEQQILAMARALMLKPKLLLLDEPSLGLSPNYVDVVFDKISEINKQGTSILLVEQNARMALEIAHRGYVFKIGEIAMADDAQNLLENDEVKKAFLGE